MSQQEKIISMPLSHLQKSNTNCYNISIDCTHFSWSPPTFWIVHVTNFLYFQIINTSNLCCNQSNGYCCKLCAFLTRPNNCGFSEETIYGRKTPLTYHLYCPSKGHSSRTLILSFLIPNILWSCCFHRRFRWTSLIDYKLRPNSKIH